VDEVHKVKNPASRTSKALQQFACKRRFGLTGTAMQNRYSELHTVLDWCFPGRLGDKNQWRDYVESPLKEAQRKDATQQQLAIGRVSAFVLSTSTIC
jgi:SNF2 family DNA or RNA helicase